MESRRARSGGPASGVQATGSQPIGSQATGSQAMDFRIPSDVQYIGPIVEQVVQRCAALRFSRRHLSLNVPVALTEALSNAILRGNLDDAAKSVCVRADVDTFRLVLEVRDEGAGFDLELCTGDPTTPANLLREDGRGLFLMRRLMDHVERFNDGGNVVRLILRRA
jgi:serine/threonine-protein kinase RsbW